MIGERQSFDDSSSFAPTWRTPLDANANTAYTTNLSPNEACNERIFIRSFRAGGKLKVFENDKGKRVLNEGMLFDKNNGNSPKRVLRFTLLSEVIEGYFDEPTKVKLENGEYVIFCDFYLLRNLRSDEVVDKWCGDGRACWSSTAFAGVIDKRCFHHSYEVHENGDVDFIGYPLKVDEEWKNTKSGCYRQFSMKIRHKYDPNDVLAEFQLDIKKNLSNKNNFGFHQSKREEEFVVECRLNPSSSSTSRRRGRNCSGKRKREAYEFRMEEENEPARKKRKLNPTTTRINDPSFTSLQRKEEEEGEGDAFFDTLPCGVVFFDDLILRNDENNDDYDDNYRTELQLWNYDYNPFC